MALEFTGGHVAAGSPDIYRDGLGCGACFQVRCKNTRVCRSAGVKVTLTYLNKGNAAGLVLNKGAFMVMAKNGKAQELMRRGIVDVEYKRYVSAGTSWLNGAFGKVAKAGHIAGARTKEKFQLAVSNLTAKKPGRRLCISVHSEGAVKVLSIVDSNYHVVNNLKGSGSLGFRDKEVVDQKMSNARYTEIFTIHVPFIGISLMNSTPQELIFV